MGTEGRCPSPLVGFAVSGGRQSWEHPGLFAACREIDTVISFLSRK